MKLFGVFTPKRKREGSSEDREDKKPILVAFAHCKDCGWTRSGAGDDYLAVQWITGHKLACPYTRERRRLLKEVDRLFKVSTYQGRIYRSSFFAGLV